jgi:hypothetical protein
MTESIRTLGSLGEVFEPRPDRGARRISRNRAHTRVNENAREFFSRERHEPHPRSALGNRPLDVRVVCLCVSKRRPRAGEPRDSQGDLFIANYNTQSVSDVTAIAPTRWFTESRAHFLLGEDRVNSTNQRDAMAEDLTQTPSARTNGLWKWLRGGAGMGSLWWTIGDAEKLRARFDPVTAFGELLSDWDAFAYGAWLWNVPPLTGSQNDLADMARHIADNLEVGQGSTLTPSFATFAYKTKKCRDLPAQFSSERRLFRIGE